MSEKDPNWWVKNLNPYFENPRWHIQYGTLRPKLMCQNNEKLAGGIVGGVSDQKSNTFRN